MNISNYGNIVAEYIDDKMGYLIQKAEYRGEIYYRYIIVKAGEEDEYGKFFSTQQEAVKNAVDDWYKNKQGDNWADWGREMIDRMSSGYVTMRQEFPESAKLNVHDFSPADMVALVESMSALGYLSQDCHKRPEQIVHEFLGVNSHELEKERKTMLDNLIQS